MAHERDDTTSTKYAFDKEAIERFQKKVGVNIELNTEQTAAIENSFQTTLQIGQIAGIVRSLCPTSQSLFRFVESGTAELQPISLSLFVLNEDTWRLMQKKRDHQTNMLPMLTIPWFYWEPAAKSRTNPLGVRRDTHGQLGTSVLEDKSRMVFSGTGGNFAGLIEGRIVQRLTGMRPVFLPGAVGEREKVPHYECQRLQITVDPSESECALYPVPDRRLDFRFSESPKVFHEHGLRIDCANASVHLRVGANPETVLRGETKILIGKTPVSAQDSESTLGFHVWLNAVERAMSLSGGGPKPVLKFVRRRSLSLKDSSTADLLLFSLPIHTPDVVASNANRIANKSTKTEDTSTCLPTTACLQAVVGLPELSYRCSSTSGWRAIRQPPTMSMPPNSTVRALETIKNTDTPAKAKRRIKPRRRSTTTMTEDTAMASKTN